MTREHRSNRSPTLSPNKFSIGQDRNNNHNNIDLRLGYSRSTLARPWKLRMVLWICWRWIFLDFDAPLKSSQALHGRDSEVMREPSLDFSILQLRLVFISQCPQGSALSWRDNPGDRRCMCGHAFSRLPRCRRSVENRCICICMHARGFSKIDHKRHALLPSRSLVVHVRNQGREERGIRYIRTYLSRSPLRALLRKDRQSP